MASTRKPKSLKDIAAKATPAERVIPLCLAGALNAEHERLEQELEDAQEAAASNGARLNSATPGRDIADKIAALEAQMREQTADFTMRALPGKKWSDLKAAHPPKDGKVVDLGTFPGAAVVACCISPEGMDDPEQFDPFWDGLSAGQQAALFDAAWSLNEGQLTVPFSVRASALRQTSEPSLTTQPPSVSRAASS